MSNFQEGFQLLEKLFGNGKDNIIALGTMHEKQIVMDNHGQLYVV
jgi:hypothetical protein